jgi:hypothetical protein
VPATIRVLAKQRQQRQEQTMAKTTTKTAQTKRPKAGAGTKKERGYKGHIAGSRKGDVHQAFDKVGPEKAMALGLAAGLKEGTLKSWFGGWSRSAKPAPKEKPATSNAA